MPRRVAVTGVGVVSAFGADAEAFWAGCLEGRTVVAPIPDNWRAFADYHSTLWSPLPDFDAETLESNRIEMAQNDLVSLMAAKAAREALSHGGFTLADRNKRARTHYTEGVEPSRAGVFMGTGVGGATTFLQNHAFQALSRSKERLSAVRGTLEAGDPRAAELAGVVDNLAIGPRFNPFVVSMLMPNAVPSLLGQKYSFTGPNQASAIACASGTVAIGNAFDAVRAGRVDVALAGGSEYLYDHYGSIFLGFDIAGALVRDCDQPERANRPFDESRSGFLFSQGGAAVVVLESMEGALARGATILAELAGYGESFDAHSMMQIEPGGAQIERMIRIALGDAGLEPEEVQYVNAHGTGTLANDAVEAEVIERVFGSRVRVNSTKSLLGHTIGASGALEAAVTVLSLHHQTTHACRNLDNPIAGLNFVRRVEPMELSAAFSQSFAFGGHNAGLVFKRAAA